jgi:hypothetical protein
VAKLNNKLLQFRFKEKARSAIRDDTAAFSHCTINSYRGALEVFL